MADHAQLCIRVKNLSYFYKDRRDNLVLDNVSFDLGKGEVMAIIGPNGSGKTTLINLVAEFLRPRSGKIFYHSDSVAPAFSSVVFQDSVLLEWKSAFRNIELSLLSTISHSSRRKLIVEEHLRLLGIPEHKDKLPAELSGGLRQRVAIARALACNPRLLLLDEPFSSLDLPSKEALKYDLLKIIREKNKSVLLVTHDIDEAIMFSDRILMLSSDQEPGYEIVEIDIPKEKRAQQGANLTKLRAYILEKMNN